MKSALDALAEANEWVQNVTAVPGHIPGDLRTLHNKLFLIYDQVKNIPVRRPSE